LIGQVQSQSRLQGSGALSNAALSLDEGVMLKINFKLVLLVVLLIPLGGVAFVGLALIGF
jgi:hypothetical protein